MSWQATAFVKSLTVSSTGQKINRGEKLILLLLADYIDPNTGIAWPSIRSLADDGLYEKQQVLRIISSLENKGFVSVVKGHGRCPNRYSIVGLSTKCHQKSKSSFGDISKSFGDILPTFGDIAMSPEPHTEPHTKPPKITSGLFDKAYKAYPRHVGRPAAEKAWAAIGSRLNKLASLDNSPFKGIGDVDKAEEYIYQRVVQYAVACQRTHKEKQFIPHMATWLNQDRFMDDSTEWATEAQNGQRQTSKAERRNARISETTRRVLDPAKHITGYVTKSLPDGDT